MIEYPLARVKSLAYTIYNIRGHSLVEEFITKDYQASVQAVLDSALGGVESANFEFPLITKAGARIEVLLNATTRRNEHGKIIGRLDAVRFSLSVHFSVSCFIKLLRVLLLRCGWDRTRHHRSYCTRT